VPGSMSTVPWKLSTLTLGLVASSFTVGPAAARAAAAGPGEPAALAGAMHGAMIMAAARPATASSLRRGYKRVNCIDDSGFPQWRGRKAPPRARGEGRHGEGSRPADGWPAWLLAGQAGPGSR